MKKLMLSILSAALVILTVFSQPTEILAEVGTTYYVSSSKGNDENNGKTTGAPFKTLHVINEMEFGPGDSILLEADSVFDDQFIHLKGSGSKGLPITIGRYGEGSDPIINTNAKGIWYQDFGKALDSSAHKYKGDVSSSIHLFDTSFVEISDLELTNRAPEGEVYNAIDVMDRTGVSAVAQNKGTVEHIYLNNLYIHDVQGNVYNKHMNNGGIYFTVAKPLDEAVTGISRYHDIRIENSRVEDVNRWGIAVGYTAYWDKFLGSAISDENAKKYGSTEVVIRNNYIKNAGGDAITGMYLDKPLFEYNVSEGAAKQINPTDYSATATGRVAVAIWAWKCKDAIFQFNEAYNTYENQDGQAWDFDYGDGTIYQYNYSHNNGGGTLLICLYESYNSIFRYNISLDDQKAILDMPDHPYATVYNNTFIIPEGVPFIKPISFKLGRADIENNIIYRRGEAASEDWRDTEQVKFDNNLYFGFTNLPKNEGNAVVGDPLFVGLEGPTEFTGKNPSSGLITHDRSAFDNFKVKKDSPATNNGKYIENPGDTDFFGNPLGPVHSIGAFAGSEKTTRVYSSNPSIIVDQESKKITGIGKSVTTEKAKTMFRYDTTMTFSLIKEDGTSLGSEEFITETTRLVISDDTGENRSLDSTTYTFFNLGSDKKDIVETNYMVENSKSLISLPSIEKAPISVSDFLNGLEVSEFAIVSLLDSGTEYTGATLKDGLTVRITAENGTHRDYDLNLKNRYHWALDFNLKESNNTWHPQVKSGGLYENLTSYDGQWPNFNGASYALVGVDLPNHTQAADENTHGLLGDAMDKGQRKEGHSMAYRVPLNGKIKFELSNGEPYLRQDGNTGGYVNLSLTHNGKVLQTVKLEQSKVKGAFESMVLEVKAGDMIRLEANNVDSPSRPSIHATPIITYLETNVDELEKEIVSTTYMFDREKGKLSIPSILNNPTLIEEVKSNIVVSENAIIEFYDGTLPYKDDKIKDGLTLRVVDTDGNYNAYEIEVKNIYNWALDYSGQTNLNVWSGQYKENDNYSELKTYDPTYPNWVGVDYALVGVDLQSHAESTNEDTHGLLGDTMNPSMRKQGHSMAYTVPQDGRIKFDLKDGEPYLRQAGNQGGSVNLEFTLNGDTLQTLYLENSLEKADFESMEIDVKAGDVLRVEAKSVDNPSKPSIHVTPIITYIEQDEVIIVDKTALNEIVDEALLLDESLYTEESFKKVEDAINAGKAVLIDEQATQEIVNAAVEVIRSALDDLVEVEEVIVDKTGLVETIARAKAIEQDLYTNETVEVLNTAIEEAEVVNADLSATSVDVDSAIENLETAIDSLVEKEEPSNPIVDKSKLQQIVNEAKAIILDDYTEESSKQVIESLNIALNLLNDDKATQDTIDSATKSLRSAIDALIENDEVVEEPEETPKPETKPENKPAVDQEEGSKEDSGNLPSTGVQVQTGVYLVSVASLISGILLLIKRRRNLN